jgi:hypothetical protein
LLSLIPVLPNLCAQMYGTAAEAASRQVFLDWLAGYAPGVMN